MTTQIRTIPINNSKNYKPNDEVIGPCNPFPRGVVYNLCAEVYYYPLSIVVLFDRFVSHLLVLLFLDNDDDDDWTTF